MKGHGADTRFLLPSADGSSDAILVRERRELRELRRRGFAVERFLPLPAAEPSLFLPLDRPLPARYALTELTLPGRRWKQRRNQALATLIDRHVVPPLGPLVAVAQPEPRAPFFVSATRQLGLPRNVDWLLEPGSGDELARGVFHLFRTGEGRPAWILKYARVPHYVVPFERDERGLRVAREAGSVTATHAPTLVGRVMVENIHASVETAAAGPRLIAVLTAHGSRAAKQEVVERIAEWIVATGRETAARSDHFATNAPVPADLAGTLAALPPVAAHSDLGTWNLVVDGDGFVAIDWESARANGYPLWDLWYFLLDALAHLDGVAQLPEQERHFTRLFAGELPSSELLFRWTRRAAEACAVPSEAVGPLATMCWLHHGSSHVGREAALGEHTPDAEPPAFLIQRTPRLWSEHPALGPGWNAWRR